jgi:hypothetical protein
MKFTMKILPEITTLRLNEFTCNYVIESEFVWHAMRFTTPCVFIMTVMMMIALLISQMGAMNPEVL